MKLRHVQCSGRNGCDKADVPVGVQAQSVPDSNVGLDAGGGNLGISRRGMGRLPLQLPVGLWDEWKDKASGETLKSCTMIRSSPSRVSEVHDRMPVLLAEKDYETVAERQRRSRIAQARRRSTKLGSFRKRDDFAWARARWPSWLERFQASAAAQPRFKSLFTE